MQALDQAKADLSAKQGALDTAKAAEQELDSKVKELEGKLERAKHDHGRVREGHREASRVKEEMLEWRKQNE